MKLPEMPASIKTQLEAYNSTIADAEVKIATAKADRQRMLDAFYNMMGKLIRVTETYRKAGTRVKHFRVDAVNYGRDGQILDLSGQVVKSDGATSHIRHRLYSYEIRDAKWRVVDSVDA